MFEFFSKISKHYSVQTFVDLQYILDDYLQHTRERHYHGKPCYTGVNTFWVQSMLPGLDSLCCNLACTNAKLNRNIAQNYKSNKSLGAWNVGSGEGRGKLCIHKCG